MTTAARHTQKSTGSAGSDHLGHDDLDLDLTFWIPELPIAGRLVVSGKWP